MWTDLCAGCNVREPWEHRCLDPRCPCADCTEERRIFSESSRWEDVDA